MGERILALALLLLLGKKEMRAHAGKFESPVSSFKNKKFRNISANISAIIAATGTRRRCRA